MSGDLEQSYRYCRAVARDRAKNFYYSFVLLPREKRDAMCAVYAFMRYCDDLSDEPGASREALDRWRAALHNALAGKYDGHPALPAFHDTVQRYKIPHTYFEEMIDGVSSDLEPRWIQTFDELYRYCYQVASVVGMTIIHVFGFNSPDALKQAEICGIAFQVTNILRDVKEDLDRGRVYIPAEDMRRFGVTEMTYSPKFVELMRYEASRARAYYDDSVPLIEAVDPKSRAGLRALIEIYSRLLRKIEAANYDVLSRRISLSVGEKCWIVLRAALR